MLFEPTIKTFTNSGRGQRRDGDGTRPVVFVAGSTDGWRLWNTDSDPHPPEQAVRPVGQNSLAAFDRTALL